MSIYNDLDRVFFRTIILWGFQMSNITDWLQGSNNFLPFKKLLYAQNKLEVFCNCVYDAHYVCHNSLWFIDEPLQNRLQHLVNYVYLFLVFWISFLIETKQTSKIDAIFQMTWSNAYSIQKNLKKECIYSKTMLFGPFTSQNYKND